MNNCNYLVENDKLKCPASNGRFGASGAVARPKVCTNLEVLRPSERQWKPRLRQAAGTLGASGEQRNRKRLKVNANNRSERAEQKKYQSEICCRKSESFT